MNGFELREPLGNRLGAGPGGDQASVELAKQILADRVEPRVLAQVGRLVGIVLEVEEPLVGP